MRIRRGLQAAGVAVAVVTVAVIATTLRQPPPAPEPGRRPDPAATESRVFGQQWSECMGAVEPAALRQQAFGFDGVVELVGYPIDPERVSVPVTFQVRHWFRGGTSPQVTVALPIASAAYYPPGTRVLVAGPPFGTGCGFTRRYTPPLAQKWADALLSATQQPAAWPASGA